jgi:hypothetical protein
VGALPGAAKATEGPSAQHIITLEAPASLEAGMVPVPVPLECTPRTIETGIDCGMADMCGLDPCLCGNPDAWGACACNGTRTTTVELEVLVADAAVADVVRVGDAWWLLPNGTGDTTVIVTATLPHHAAATKTLPLHVEAPFPPSVFWCAIGLAVAALLLLALVFLTRKRAQDRLAKASALTGDSEVENEAESEATDCPKVEAPGLTPATDCPKVEAPGHVPATDCAKVEASGNAQASDHPEVDE